MHNKKPQGSQFWSQQYRPIMKRTPHVVCHMLVENRKQAQFVHCTLGLKNNRNMKCTNVISFVPGKYIEEIISLWGSMNSSQKQNAANEQKCAKRAAGVISLQYSFKTLRLQFKQIIVVESTTVIQSFKNGILFVERHS